MKDMKTEYKSGKEIPTPNQEGEKFMGPESEFSKTTSHDKQKFIRKEFGNYKICQVRVYGWIF